MERYTSRHAFQRNARESKIKTVTRKNKFSKIARGPGGKPTKEKKPLSLSLVFQFASFSPIVALSLPLFP